MVYSLARGNVSAQLHHADCLTVMASLPAESVEMIFADPPYFLSNGGITCQAGQMISVNKGTWDTGSDPEQILAFNLAWLKECRRLLTPNGTIWVSGTSHNIFNVGYAMQQLGYKIINDIAWHKVNPSPNLACRSFTHAHETILWAKKSGKAKHYFDYAAMKAENGGKQMQSLWYFTPPKKDEKRYGKHPTQKPEALLERIVSASTQPGDRILDPFMGSGTTAVAALRLGRNFVGCEREEEYVQKTIARLTDLAKSPRPLGERVG